MVASPSRSSAIERTEGRASGASQPRQKLLAVRLALVATGLLAPLLALELALRLVGPLLPGEYQTASFVEAHPEFGRRNRPGQGWKQTSEYRTWIEVNSKGLRGPAVEYGKPSGEVRILVLGDSFTFAEQVSQSDTFVQRLEDRLNAAGSARYRVLNGGSNGWSTANELVFLAEEGLKYQPDVVVLAFYTGNDVSDNYRRVGTVQDAERASLALRGVDAFEGPRRILRGSEAYTVFETGVLAKLPWWQAPQSDASLRPPPRTREEADEAWGITASLLRRMRQVADNQGARFMVMEIPSAQRVAGGPRGKESDAEDDSADDESVPGLEDPQATLAEIGSRLEVPMLDLLPAFRFRAARSRERLFYRANAHFTAAGHAIAADKLYELLTSRGWVAAGQPAAVEAGRTAAR